MPLKALWISVCANEDGCAMSRLPSRYSADSLSILQYRARVAGLTRLATYTRLGTHCRTRLAEFNLWSQWASLQARSRCSSPSVTVVSGCEREYYVDGSAASAGLVLRRTRSVTNDSVRPALLRTERCAAALKASALSP